MDSVLHVSQGIFDFIMEIWVCILYFNIVCIVFKMLSSLEVNKIIIIIIIIINKPIL